MLVLYFYITLKYLIIKKDFTFVALTSLTRHIDCTMKLSILEMSVKQTFTVSAINTSQKH